MWNVPFSALRGYMIIKSDNQNYSAAYPSRLVRLYRCLRTRARCSSLELEQECRRFCRRFISFWAFITACKRAASSRPKRLLVVLPFTSSWKLTWHASHHLFICGARDTEWKFFAEGSNQPNASPFFTFFSSLGFTCQGHLCNPSDDPYVHGGSNDCLEGIRFDVVDSFRSSRHFLDPRRRGGGDEPRVRACWSWQSWRLNCSFSSVSQLCLEIFDAYS
jgi:hypothetical protein